MMDVGEAGLGPTLTGLKDIANVYPGRFEQSQGQSPFTSSLSAEPRFCGNPSPPHVHGPSPTSLEVCMRRAVWIPLVLSGCMPALSGQPTGPHGLSCAKEITIGLGYEILSEDREEGIGGFTAQRHLADGGYYPLTAELHVAVWGDRRGEYRMKAEGARYEERVSSAQEAPPRVGSTFAPRGGSGVNEVRIGSRHRGRTRLSPGPVAEDVNVIQASCGRSQDR